MGTTQMIQHGYQYRLEPTDEQQQLLNRQFGSVRFVFNYFLALRSSHYQQTGAGLKYHDTAALLTALKQQPETAWLKLPHSQVLQQALLDLDSAFQNFFAGKGKYPRFKKKSGHQKCRYPQGVKIRQVQPDSKAAQVWLPKIGWVTFICHRPIEGQILFATVRRRPSGKYFISFNVEREIESPQFEGATCGVDVGLTHFATLSTGEQIPNPRHLRRSERRLVRLQRRLSRCQQGSKGHEQARLQVARQHEKVTNQRQDFQHKLSYRLVHENQMLRVEDLNIAGMKKNRRLAKSISDAAWSEFIRQLQYKGRWYGCEVEKINRFYPSSQTCHICNYRQTDLTLRDRMWICPDCGTLHDRDRNAAINIRDYRKAKSTAGRAGTLTPVERL
jgi:putative transposase